MDLYLPPKPAIIIPGTVSQPEKVAKPDKGVFGAPLGFFGKEPTVVTLLGTNTLTFNSSSWSSSISLGTARPDRVIVAFFYCENGGTGTYPAACTGFFGVSPSVLGPGGGFATILMLHAVVPSGTSGTISFAHPTNNMLAACLSVYSITGLVSTSRLSYLNSNGTLTTAVGGVALAGTFLSTVDTNVGGSGWVKTRVVAGGTGAGFSMNTFYMNPTPTTATGAASSGTTTSISFY